jgi:hypothetical protein
MRSWTGAAPAYWEVAKYVPGLGISGRCLHPVRERRPFQVIFHSNACWLASVLVVGLTSRAQSLLLQIRSVPE